MYTPLKTLRPTGFLLGAAILVASALATHANAQWADPAWQPDDQAALAVQGANPVTELDVYVYRLMTGHDPLVVRDWQIAGQRGGVEQLAELERTVLEIVEMRIAARLAEAEGMADNIAARKHARMLTAPTANVVFATEVVAPTVDIAPLDIALYYRQNIEEFRSPERLVVRRLRVPVEGSGGAADVAEARGVANRLRADAIRLGGLEPLLRDNPAFRMEEPGAPGLAVRRGDGRLAPPVEDAAFGMAIGQVSPPVLTSSAFVLVEVIDREPGAVTPLASAADTIRARLASNHLLEQLRTKTIEATADARPIERSALFPFMDDNLELVRVRDFRLYKDEFLWIFPQFEGPMERVTPALRAVVAQIVGGEIVNQEVERAGLITDPRYARAREVAMQRVLADAFARRPLDIEVTDDQAAAYVAANREALAPPMRKTVWRITAEPRNPGRMSFGARLQLQREMEDLLAGSLDGAVRQLAERAAIAGPGALADPQRVLRRILPDQDRFDVRFANLGEFDQAEARRVLALDLARVPVGQFSQPRVFGADSVGVFYVSGERFVPSPPEQELLSRARQGLRDEAAAAPVRETLAGLERSGTLVWLFDRPSLSAGE